MGKSAIFNSYVKLPEGKRDEPPSALGSFFFLMAQITKDLRAHDLDAEAASSKVGCRIHRKRVAKCGSHPALWDIHKYNGYNI